MNAVTDFTEFSLTKRTSLLAVPGVHPHAGSGALWSECLDRIRFATNVLSQRKILIEIELSSAPGIRWRSVQDTGICKTNAMAVMGRTIRR